mgnify:FL=1
MYLHIGKDTLIDTNGIIAILNIETLEKGAKILRIEIGVSTNDGIRWDKIVLANGTKGYINSTYIKRISDITNCSERAIANTDVNLRNGPGTSNTTVITTLTEGQALTIIEKGQYNGVDGYNWYKVKLNNGTQGYLASKYLNIVSSGSDDSGNELVKVVCEYGLKIRENPGIDAKCLTIVEKGTILTRTQKAVSNKNGYTWDKVVTGNGIIGYVARAGGSEQNIEPIESDKPQEPQEPENTNDIFKIDGTNLMCVPKTTVENIKTKYNNTIIKKGNEEIKTGNVGTGYKVIIEEKEYIIIVKGDTNCDGKITPADSTAILKEYVGISKLSDEAKLAADTNKDGKITPADSTLILRAYVGLNNISI